jgi:hypothetical protein
MIAPSLTRNSTGTWHAGKEKTTRLYKYIRRSVPENASLRTRTRTSGVRRELARECRTEQSSAASMCRSARRGHRHVPGGSGGGTRAVGLRLRSERVEVEVKDGALSAVPPRPARGLV